MAWVRWLLQGRVVEVQGEIEAAQAALEAGLQRRRQLAATRETLELLVDASHIVSKVRHGRQRARRCTP